MHILEHHFASGHLVAAYDCHKRNLLAIRIAHLLFHLRWLGIYLHAHALLAQHFRPTQRIEQFLLAEGSEEQLRRRLQVLRIEVQLGEHIVYAVCAEGDTHTRHVWHAEDTREVIVASATRNTTHLHIQGFHLEDSTCVVVQAARKAEIQLHLQATWIVGSQIPILRACRVEREDRAQFLDTFQSHFATREYLLQLVKFLGVSTAEMQDWLQGIDSLLWQPFVEQLFVHIVDTNLVQFVDSYGDINDALGLTDDFGYACEYLAVVDMQRNANTETAIDLCYYLNKLHLAEQGVRTYYIHVALIELAVATFLRTVSTPYGLNLIAFEGELNFLTMLHYEARKWHSQVIAQTFLADLGGQGADSGLVECLVGDSAFPITRIENLEEQLVAFLAVLTHQRREVLHGGGLYLLKAIE